jgi:hypothetical protein
MTYEELCPFNSKAQETEVSESEPVIELAWILQGNLLLVPSPVACWL